LLLFYRRVSLLAGTLLVLVGVVGPAVAARASDGIVAKSSGAAILSIPIAVPPGPGGFEPKLALTYSSRGGDGAFGVGWSLGLPEIRCSARHGVPQNFASCDEYELGDTLLVSTGSGEYHTKVESFQRIHFYGAWTGWTVEQPNGTKLTFGASPNHRSLNAPGGSPARWLLQRMEDAYGNGIDFTYDFGGSDNDPIPSAITYGNPSGSRQVLFILDSSNRPDPRLVFAGGIERRLHRRVTEIQVRSSGNAIYRRYALTYASSGYTTVRSRIEKVQEFGTGCTAASVASCTGLPPRTFDYRDAADVTDKWSAPHEHDAHRIPFGDYSTPGVIVPPANTNLIGDINGDGLPDHISIYSYLHNYDLASITIEINTKDGFVALHTGDSYFDSFFRDLVYSQPRLDYKQIPMPHPATPFANEWDGNNYAMCWLNVTYQNVNLAQQLYGRGVFSTTSSLANLRASGNGPPNNEFFEPRPSVKLVDLDADGLADLVVSFWLHGAKQQVDCSGQPVAGSQEVNEHVRVVFRNTGSGWVKDDALAANLPPFEEIMVKSSYQTYTDEHYTVLFGLPGDNEATSACANLSLRGFEMYDTSDPNPEAGKTGVCHAPIDLAPEFADFNGDGYPDIAVLERERWGTFYTGMRDIPYFNGSTGDNRARTHVYVQKPGSVPRWAPAPQYDLPPDIWPTVAFGATNIPPTAPFAHAGLQHMLAGPVNHTDHNLRCFSWSGQPGNAFPDCGWPNIYRFDNGVRLADLNHDGLVDVVWHTGDRHGVLLNRGDPSGSASSAWCASESDDVPLVGNHSCAEGASFVPPTTFIEPNPATFYLTMTTGMLGDLNGDGFLDFMRLVISPQFGYYDREVWIRNPGAVAVDQAWILAPAFVPPIEWLRPVTWGYGTVSPGNGVIPRYELLDIDGDGTDDVVGDQHAFFSKAEHADLLGSVDNHRGGTVAISYASMLQQSDSGLENADRYPVIPWADAAGNIALWRASPVVSSVTLYARNLPAAGDTTTYAYAHPRFDRAQFSDLGFGLVRSTHYGTSSEDYFYQDPGRTGRIARRIVKDSVAGAMEQFDANWVQVPMGTYVRGWGAGTYLAQLASEVSANLYGGNLGAMLERDYTYNNSYGYNFIASVRTKREASDVLREFTPDWQSRENPWVMGLVQSYSDLNQLTNGTLVAQTDFTYTSQGKIQQETRHRDSTHLDDTVYGYDGDGNLAQRTDDNGHITSFVFDGNGALIRRTDPVVNGQPGRITTFTPDPVLGVTAEIDPGYRDLPRTVYTFDLFARLTGVTQYPRTASSSGWQQGPGELISSTIYSDWSNPPWVEQRAHTTASDYIAVATVDDGFGGAWKTIRDAGSSGSNFKYAGTATRIDPVTRTIRTTDDIACGTDAMCSGLDGTQSPATVTVMDALGRPTSVTTSRGSSLFEYAAGNQQILRGSSIQFRDVDVVWSEDANGGLTRRAFDGDRLVRVDECTNVATNSNSPSANSCVSWTARRTLYGYHPNGKLELVKDAKSYDLQTTYDGVGNAITITDPDTFRPSVVAYDGVGNVISTTNPRLQVRNFLYDELDRPIAITSSSEGSIGFSYRADELQAYVEQGPGYQESFEYDGFGRIITENIWGGPSAHYVYDLQGRQIAVTGVGVDKAVRYEYSGAFLQRICTVTDDPNPPGCGDSSATFIVSSVTYDGLGRRKSMQMGNSSSPLLLRTFSYRDEGSGNANKPRDLIQDQLSTLTLAYGARDALGNLLGGTISGPPGTSVSANLIYAYDERNRLAMWQRNNSPGYPTNLTENFGYDELGNLTANGAVTQTFDDPIHPHWITSNGSKTFQHDQSGNVQQAGVSYYTFNSADRLVSVGSSPGESNILSAVYDTAGQRLFETVSGASRSYLGADLSIETKGAIKSWRLDIRAFGEPVAYLVREQNTNGASGSLAVPEDVPPWLVAVVPLTALALLLTLGARERRLLGMSQRPGTAALSGVLIVSLVVVPYPYPARAGGGGLSVSHYTRFVISDLIGSAMAVFDDGGMLIRATRFKPFGGIDNDYPAATSSDPQMRHVFADHARQDESKLVYMNARWQDPETGTFLSVDPIVGSTHDPQSLNAYSYARNNPVSHTDPTGADIGFPDWCAPCISYYPTTNDVFTGNGLVPPSSAAFKSISSFDPSSAFSGISSAGSSTDASGVETIPVIGSRGELGGTAEFGLLSSSWTTVGDMDVIAGIYGYRSQSSSARGNDNLLPPPLVERTYTEEIGAQSRDKFVVRNAEGRAVVHVTTKGEASVAGTINQTRSGANVGEQTRVGSLDPFYSLTVNVSADHPLDRTVNPPGGGPRDIQVEFGNFGPSAVQVEAIYFVRPVSTMIADH